MKETKVVNIRFEECDVYIGRKRGKKYHFGNPFFLTEYTRKESIDNFRRWLKGDEEFTHIEPKRRKWILENLWRLKGKRLGCFCKPKYCHGDVYVELLEEGYYEYFRK
jgi:hypothetical protein